MNLGRCLFQLTTDEYLKIRNPKSQFRNHPGAYTPGSPSSLVHPIRSPDVDLVDRQQQLASVFQIDGQHLTMGFHFVTAAFEHVLGRPPFLGETRSPATSGVGRLAAVTYRGRRSERRPGP